MVQAVLATSEDRRFFDHGGVNYTSMIGWAYHNMVGDRKHRGGASTLTMQLAKLLFLSDNGTIKYKLIQIMVAFHLEHRFTKKQIFELYANQINLGQQGSFAIDGFGEAAQAYFGKDVKQLNLAECAMLAGMIQRPSYLNPYHHPERVLARRNLVLDSMVETGAVTKDQGGERESYVSASFIAERGRERGSVLCGPGAGPTGAEAGRAGFQPRGIAHLYVARP